MDLFDKLAEIRKKKNEYTGKRSEKGYRELLREEEELWKNATESELLSWAIKMAGGVIFSYLKTKNRDLADPIKVLRVILNNFKTAKKMKELYLNKN